MGSPFVYGAATMAAIITIFAHQFNQANPLYSTYVFHDLVSFLCFAVITEAVHSVCNGMIASFTLYKVSELDVYRYLKGKELTTSSILNSTKDEADPSIPPSEAVPSEAATPSSDEENKKSEAVTPSFDNETKKHDALSGADSMVASSTI